MTTSRQACTPQDNTTPIALFLSRRKIVCRVNLPLAVEISKPCGPSSASKENIVPPKAVEVRAARQTMT
jgi:hypothetical protein